MTLLALSSLIESITSLLAALFRSSAEFVTRIQDARGMALLYQTLSGLSDHELSLRGLKRQDSRGPSSPGSSDAERAIRRDARGAISCFARRNAFVIAGRPRVACSPVAQR